MADRRIAQDILDYGVFTNSAGIISDSVATVKEDPATDLHTFFVYGESASSIRNSETIEERDADKALSVCNDVLGYGKFSYAEIPLPAVEREVAAEPVAAQPPVLDARLDVESPEPAVVQPATGQRLPTLDAKPETNSAVPDPSKMGEHDPKRMRAVFPIGVKLTACITSMLLCSLGLLTATGWFFTGADTRRTAEKHNADVNYRAALTAETTLSSVKNNVSLLFYGLDQPKPETVSSFFEEHPDIASILSGEYEGRPFINEQFFLNHGIDASLAITCLDQMDLKNRTLREEPILLNAAPFFNGLPLLAMRFPADRGWVAVFFSLERLAENFGGSENASILLNMRGDVLVHADQDIIRKESNFSDFSAMPVLQKFADSGKTAAQTRYTDIKGDAYLAAIRRFNIADNATQVKGVATDTGNDLFALTAIPEAAVLENTNTITRLSLYLSLAAGFIAIFFMQFFSKTISVPFKLLKTAVQAVEDGNYTMTDNSRCDEIGVLTESVNNMIRKLARVESFANKKIAQQIWKGRLVAEGTQKEATVFFSSLCSFTENDDNPEETVAVLNDYLERICSCIARTGGTVNRCIGATIMAYWGATDSGVNTAGNAEQNAINAVCAALMMRAAIRSLNDSLDETRGGDSPHVRASCGLNSGSVTAAQIGGSDRLEYTVIGDAVMLANHTQGFCEVFGAEIIITENTRDLIKDTFIIEKLPPVKDKGKDIKLFAVVNVRKLATLEWIFSNIEQMPKTNPHTSRLYLGPSAPQNMAELRKMLGLSTPDISKAMHEGEKKYVIQTGD
ncbi:MAG: HAMP domain-containing protein [Treponema sp.]|nr:HAMP domain-containing protein [Treponema sp.]